MNDSQQKEKRILLIEDDHVYRTVLLSTLRTLGYHCSFCVDGIQAYKTLSKEKFNLLIVDYLLPGTNGVEIIQSIRSKGVQTPALLITNYPAEVLNVSNKALGRTKILAKTSFNRENIPKIVDGMLTT